MPHGEQPLQFVEETKLGNIFLQSRTWKIHVLKRALNDLRPLMAGLATHYARILDVGCGYGHSFYELSERFTPDIIIGLDADPQLLQRAGPSAKASDVPVKLLAGHAARIDCEDNSIDLLLCHQTFHHLVEQEQALKEFFRVLKPGGVLLFAESTKRYIHSLLIRLFFRHPMDVQKTAEEYRAMIRASGFELPDERISMPFLWWSRPDLGFLEWIGIPVPKEREETLFNAVAVKPLHS
ncbi:MAG: class I SAM-dependent methyltransferase [Rhodocyclaceae bacterium]|nr:MAG: class I SAM-dependent methyltransferase [Rhodocyclaceae bacterium]